MSQSDENPFRAPQMVAEGESAPAFPVLRLTISGMLLAVGMVLSLLMNGQTFTNNMAFLLLAGVSGLLWAPLATKPGCPHVSLARWTVIVHVAIVVAVLCNLPTAYKYQQRFNAKMRELRARPAQQIDINPKP
jgi:hypothetical protein